MDDALVRSQPAVLGVVEQAPIDSPKISHQRFDVLADQRRAEGVDGATDEVIAAAESESQARALDARAGLEPGDGIRILRIRVDAIGAGALGKGKAQIPSLNRFDEGQGHGLAPAVHFCSQKLVL